MQNETTEVKGIHHVEQVVREIWYCRWQELIARNDDAIDGLILYKKRGLVTDTIYTQVKCGKEYKVTPGTFPDHICIKLGIDYIKKHKPRWLSLPGPVILIYVEPAQVSWKSTAWWTDLKNPESYSDSAKSYILVPKEQKFDISSKKQIYSLTGHRYQESVLTNINIDNNLLTHLNLKDKSIKKIGSEYYKFLSEQKLTPASKELSSGIRFTRVGWRHITRKTRSLQRIIQSLLLLPVAKEIIEQIENFEIVDHYSIEDDEKNIIHYQTLLLRARISFSFRYPTIVNLLLKRKIIVSAEKGEPSSKVWFYSIYESRRGRELVR
ncbi:MULTISPECIES: DUF4365 domain-containing protein [Bacillus cereus group]|uniref:DUF4365 domain-containing protein n=1 Tax=Bacillus cereus group TaxID=86661 RepID=UPI000872F975|nr:MULTISPECIES: DUF4365 domain-containing protein [Bacillus cereus group]OFD08410.1 hypothetical protein BTGOE7_19060 [Bacillus thuringiensis]MBJ8050096.1 DUF4365 domain-containing protein [Bacillus cereus group sp. N18]PEA65985.1 DUF4365 domain-containing protein [Bacillus toyonensis]PED95473.1 DUF4365 domain-containing protein [Bacillus toyonensis]PFX82791.1 DUF4365 domain-containing protein [Bacillus toyonensis]